MNSTYNRKCFASGKVWMHGVRSALVFKLACHSAHTNSIMSRSGMWCLTLNNNICSMFTVHCSLQIIIQFDNAMCTCNFRLWYPSAHLYSNTNKLLCSLSLSFRVSIWVRLWHIKSEKHIRVLLCCVDFICKMVVLWNVWMLLSGTTMMPMIMDKISKCLEMAWSLVQFGVMVFMFSNSLRMYLKYSSEYVRYRTIPGTTQ